MFPGSRGSSGRERNDKPAAAVTSRFSLGDRGGGGGGGGGKEVSDEPAQEDVRKETPDAPKTAPAPQDKAKPERSRSRDSGETLKISVCACMRVFVFMFLCGCACGCLRVCGSRILPGMIPEIQVWDGMVHLTCEHWNILIIPL